MKKLLTGILSLMFIIIMISCADDKDPQFRVYNERSTKVNLQIQTTGGNTININDVVSGKTTSYQTCAEGSITATAVIQNESVSPAVTFSAVKGNSYTIVIQSGLIPVLRVNRD